MYTSIPSLILDPAMKSNMKGWIDALTKYYTKNRKNI